MRDAPLVSTTLSINIERSLSFRRLYYQTPGNFSYLELVYLTFQVSCSWPAGQPCSAVGLPKSLPFRPYRRWQCRASGQIDGAPSRSDLIFRPTWGPGMVAFGRGPVARRASHLDLRKGTRKRAGSCSIKIIRESREKVYYYTGIEIVRKVGKRYETLIGVDRKYPSNWSPVERKINQGYQENPLRRYILPIG